MTNNQIPSIPNNIQWFKSQYPNCLVIEDCVISHCLEIGDW